MMPRSMVRLSGRASMSDELQRCSAFKRHSVPGLRPAGG
jgi:hypothetical protein